MHTVLLNYDRRFNSIRGFFVKKWVSVFIKQGCSRSELISLFFARLIVSVAKLLLRNVVSKSNFSLKNELVTELLTSY